MAGAATPGIAALVKAGVPHQILHFEVISDLSEGTDTQPEQVFKTGVAKAIMAEPAAAERTTGYVVGGISPFGQRKLLRTVVDSSALSWDRVLVSAGKRHWDVAITPQDLIRVTGAVTADIQAHS